jgi:hypothetical protein
MRVLRGHGRRVHERGRLATAGGASAGQEAEEGSRDPENAA